MTERFLELLYENQGIVYKVCHLYFGEKVEKEDYHQELIIQLWKAFPSYKNTAKFSSWMYRVCINAAIDIKRKEKRQLRFVKLSEAKSQAVSVTHSTNNKQEKLYKAISRLSDVDRAIIMLYLEEYSYKEIAETIGISESYTGVKINRIKVKIIKSFANGNEGAKKDMENTRRRKLGRQ
ncbi:MAG: sigma-70 family RNA polymerase sigma factor [Bacteroidota bacterium]